MMEKVKEAVELRRAGNYNFDIEVDGGLDKYTIWDAVRAGAEVIVGYYHILATGIDQAIEIAKGNPEFAYTTTARVEVRPIKTKETATAYVYPQGQ